MELKKSFNKNYEIIFELLALVIISILATLPFFFDRQVHVGQDDWAFHFARIRSVLHSMEQGQIAFPVNFLDFQTQGIGINSMYPFFSLYIFIWPFLLPVTLVKKVFLCMFLINFVTSFTAWLLSREFTHKASISIFISALYVFNNWHLILEYQRLAVGELLGYTFIPLVVIGLLRIWKKKRSGIIFLALGFSLIVNSHILSVALILVPLILVELFRIITRKINLNEIVNILVSASLTALLSLVTIYNFLNLTTSNELLFPTNGRFIKTTVSTASYISDFLNIFSPKGFAGYSATSWNIGSILLLLGVVSIIYLFFSFESRRGNIYFLSSGIIGVILTIMTTDWFKNGWEIIDKITFLSKIETIQFPGRILTISVIFIVISIIGMMTNINFEQSKIVITVVSILVLFPGSYSIYKTEEQRSNILSQSAMTDGLVKPSFNNDYYSKTKLSKNQGLAPYLVTNNIIPGPIIFNRLTSTVNSTEQRISVRNNKIPQYVVTPVVDYKGIKYDSYINGKKVANKRNDDYGTVAVRSSLISRSRTSQLTIRVHQLKYEYLAMTVTVCTYMASMIALIVLKKMNND